MPHCSNSRRLKQVGDPLTACLDAHGTYICTAYSSRCYIIQKVNACPSSACLNPDADIFESKIKPPEDSETTVSSSETNTYGHVFMNGDIGKIPSGAVFAASPEPQTSCTSVNDFSSINGVVEPQEPYYDVPAPSGGSVSEAASASSPSGLPLDQLKQMLSSQLEYYFSRENLANDAYLVSQMDNDQYVPIWTVANFNQVKKLTKDIKLITEVLRESPNVQVDEEGQKVRPSHKRCIVILREIPDSTPLEEVKGLFSGKGCPRLVSCEFAHNNSWYVTFENDEDAQKAYRFLREEVREFQGKPIMARIKAKPMNRLTIPPVVSGIGTMKNGFRASPATTSGATTPAYDPTTAYPATPPRYLFNGSPLPSAVNYGNPVQIYAFQQQPYYTGMLPPPWPPTSPAYFEFGSVFSVNGLAPQPFAKTQGSRYITGSRNNRRRRKEDESPRVNNSPATGIVPQFDLEDDAFPPLPGLEASAQAIQPVPVEPLLPETTQSTLASQSHRENRLSDVVKGTAKSKPSSNNNSSTSISSCKDKDTGSPRPRSTSPPTPSLPTPPLTPDKIVPAITAATLKCCTADKSTKTDDMVMNGAATEVSDTGPSPTTNNAATMTDITTPTPQTDCSANQKLSYAQVAQHARDTKQSAERTEKLTVTTCSEEEKKEVVSGQTSPREHVAGGGRSTTSVGRGAARSVQDRRRRDSSLRFNMRTQSPK